MPLQAVAACASEAFWISSPDGARLEYVSPRHQELWHLCPDALRRDAALRFSVVHPQDRSRVERAWSSALPAGCYDTEYRILQPDGSWRWVRDRAYPVHGSDGSVARIFGIAEDVTERKEAQLALLVRSEKLLAQACRDPLTGLWNRRGFERVLLRESERAAETGRPIAAVLADCDDFKACNDALGHAGGDAVLVEIARRMLASVRACDQLARIGGDEFVVLLPETDLAEGRRAGERIAAAVSGTPLRAGRGALAVSLSMAVVAVGRDACNLGSILRQAAGPLRRSKRGGKNRVCVQAARA